MFRRRSRIRQTKRAVAGRLPSTDEVRDQVAGVTDELGDALDVARDAIAKAMSSAGRRGTEAGAEATRKGAVLGKEASRRARDAALDAVGRRLPEPEQVAEMTRRATDKMFPERAKQHRKTARKRRRRMLYGGAGAAGLGMLIGWLTAPKKGDEARQALKERASAASDKVAEMRASAGSQGPTGASTSGTDAGGELGTGTTGSMASGTGTGGPGSRGAEAGSGAQSQPAQQSADVTPIHQGDGATTSKRR